MLVANMRYMDNLTLVKNLFTEHENFYRAHHGQDMECIFKENNHLKWEIKELQEKEEVKDEKITNFKVVVANLLRNF